MKSAPQCSLQAGGGGPSRSPLEGVPEHLSARLPSCFRCVVGAAIIDHQDRVDMLGTPTYNLTHNPSFVERRYDGDESNDLPSNFQRPVEDLFVAGRRSFPTEISPHGPQNGACPECRVGIVV